jgi:hypothetical protein
LVSLPINRTCSAATSAELVLWRDLPTLLVSQAELPFEAVLFTLEGPPDYTHWFHELWFGPPTGQPETLKTAEYTIDIRLTIAGSPQEALRGISRLLKGDAVPPKEVSGEPFASFSDRAWFRFDGRGGRLLFVRGNVRAGVYMSRKDGLDPNLLLGLAALLARKIDAALAGKPEAVPVLPPSAGDMGVDLEGAWEAKTLGARLWKKQSTTVALQTGKGLPRALPAKQIARKDFTVPLGHLAAALGAKGKVKVGSQQARATLAGKAMVLSKGSAEARYGDRTVRLSRPVEFRGGQVLVPLSLVEKALGKRIVWGKRGATLLARLG